MTTIADVARYAGVSRSTVSHALSGKRTISTETRERVNEAIRVLNYRANAGAKALATSRTMIMALIVPFTPEEFAPATMQYVLTVTQTARSLGYDVLMVTEEEGADGIERVTESNLVDGVIVLDVKRHDERVAVLKASNRPGVLIGVPDGANEPIDCVDLDFAEAGRMLVRHLRERGHREVAFLTLPELLFQQDLGYAWRFRDAVVDESASLGMRLMQIAGPADPLERARTVGRLLDERGEATALLVHNDAALVDLPQLLRERDMTIPRDLSVVSLFPEQFGQMFALPYTAIDSAGLSAAARAVQLLADRITNPDREPVRELIAPVLVDRGSTRERV